MGTNAQQFCLKWNNHQANMLTVFDRLLSSRSLVDVTIGCEGRQVKAHKVVLSACSPFFENLFTENPCKHPIVILKDIRYADLKALVEFMYKGEVNVVQEQLPTLLKTAEALKIKGLAEVTGEGGKSDDNKPNATVTQRPDSPGTSSRRKRQRVRRKSTDSVVAHSDSEESVPKASRTEHDDSSMDGATSLDDGSQASLQQSNQQQTKEASINVQNSVTVNNSSLSSVVAAGGNNATTANTTTTTSNGPNSSAKDTDFEPTRLLEASMTTDHGADNNSTDLNQTGPENTLIPDGLDIKPIITLEEGGATPTGAIVPASGASSLSTGTDAISSLFPQGTGATALPGTSYQASPQSHDSGVDGDYDGCLENVNPEVFGLELKAVKPLYIVTKRSDGERIYLCDFCGYETRYKNVVTDHVRKHTGERPFVCPYCDFRCSQKPNWRRHIRRIHVGKPYYLNDPSSLPRERVPRIDFNCSMCDYSSTVPGAGLVHMSIHLNDTI